MTQASWESAIDEHPGGLGDVDWDQTSADDLPGFLDVDAPDQPLDPDDAGRVVDPAASALLKNNRRPDHAVEYQKKANNILQIGLAATINNPLTVTDAAALLVHGDAVSHALGDFAAGNDATAKILDFLDGGSNNPASALIMASLPLVFQIMRNHEPIAQIDTRVTIPFTRGKISFKVPARLKFKLQGWPRAITNDSDELYYKVFTPPVVDKLHKKGLRVASPGRHRRSNSD